MDALVRVVVKHLLVLVVEIMDRLEFVPFMVQPDGVSIVFLGASNDTVAFMIFLSQAHLSQLCVLFLSNSLVILSTLLLLKILGVVVQFLFDRPSQ